VGNSGNTTPSVASTTASQPRIINNQRVMGVLVHQSVWRYFITGFPSISSRNGRNMRTALVSRRDRGQAEPTIIVMEPT
jgi:hypothetical protein